MLAAGGFVRPFKGCLRDTIVAEIGHNCNCDCRWQCDRVRSCSPVYIGVHGSLSIARIKYV